MRIAFFSSLNPKPSGISDYSEALLPHLATQVDQVDVFIEDYEPSIPLFCDRLRVRHYREFEPEYRAGRYDGDGHRPGFLLRLLGLGGRARSKNG